jgi:hypothetical protein
MSDGNGGVADAGGLIIPDETAAELLAKALAKRETLFITDAELIQRLGIPEKIARKLLREFDRLPCSFPPKDKLCGDRRYWPAVKAWFDKRAEQLIVAQSK